jgi:hypothetical protein
MQSPTSGKGSRGVSRPLGSPLLRLQQIAVPAPGDIERMSLHTKQSAIFACKRQVAAADGASKHVLSIAVMNMREKFAADGYEPAARRDA